jgi:O-antigen ligase
MLLSAPLIRGGNRQIMLAFLLAIGLLLLSVIAAEKTHLSLVRNIYTQRTNPITSWRKFIILALLSSPIWLGLIYLLPLPIDIWATLAGRGAYLEALKSMTILAPTNLPLSLTPDATWAALLSSVPVMALFCLALTATKKITKSLLIVVLISATIQVLLSVFQLAFGADSIFYFDLKVGVSAVGSFANRNHLANFLVIALPVCTYIFFDQSKKKKTNRMSSHRHSQKQIILPFLMFLGFAYVLILLTTLSRGGLISGFIAIGMSTCIYLLALGSKTSAKQRIVYLTLAGVFVALAILASGTEGIQSRLGARLLTDADVRNTIARATLKAAWQFWPWGSGAGSFEAVFPRFQPPIDLGSLAYIEYAHNDYAQVLMELGVAGVALMAAVIVLLVNQMINFIGIYRAEKRLTSNIAMQCFCGVSFIAFLLHCWVEFNMHIPALAMTAAFLGGVFLRTPSSDKLQ